MHMNELLEVVLAYVSLGAKGSLKILLVSQVVHRSSKILLLI